MFREANAEWSARHYAKAASTAFTVGMWVAWNGSGYIAPATATTPIEDMVGICKEDIDSSDATTDKILISIPSSIDARFENDDVNGTITATKVGNTYDLSDSGSANVAASAVEVVKLVRMVSATEGVFELNK